MAGAKGRTRPTKAAGPGKGGSASAATGEGVRGKPTDLRVKKAPSKAPPCGRPPRLAHLLPGSDRNRRRARGLAAIQDGAAIRERTHPPAMVPDVVTAAAREKPADLLCLPNPEWLPQILTVTGPSAEVAAFRAAASGSGAIAWQRDYERLEEDWVHVLLAPLPAERGISVRGARVVAGQMRELIETYEARASDDAHRRCCLDLNALVPIPEKMLRLGPDDPAVLAWLWENWGTTWMLRDVEIAPIARAEILIPDGDDTVRYRFWSADWTPWRALATVRERWPGLMLHVKMLGIAE
jgi:hypothetical protein